MIRTIKIPVPKEYNKLLQEQSIKYAQAFNYVIDHGLDNNITNGTDIHHSTYYQIKELLLNFPSQFIVSARMKAVETIKGWLIAKKKRDKQILKQQEIILKGKHVRKPLRPLSRPIAKGFTTVRYDARTFSIDFKTKIISFSSIIGRQRISFNTNPYYVQYYSGKTCSADLYWSKKHKSFFFHIALEFNDPVLPEPSKVLGIDLGLNNLAVSSDGKFYLKHSVRDRIAKLRGLKSRLQSKGTPSAKRHLRKVSQKEHRFRQDVNHCVTKQIVRSAKQQGYDTIAIEDLKGIRYQNRNKAKLFRARLNSWPFDQFRQFLMYKANAGSIGLLIVNPRYTSQRCSQCGHRYLPQRKGNEFRCVNCGYQNHADLNASYNISKSGVAGGPLILKTPGITRHACMMRAEVQPAYCEK